MRRAPSAQLRRANAGQRQALTLRRSAAGVDVGDARFAQAVEEFEASDGITGFDPEIAVLADPGSCARTYGTREDFLIPSACLNSTVSGLISRTVLRTDLVGPSDFHGAKFYRELAGADSVLLALGSVTAVRASRRPSDRFAQRIPQAPGATAPALPQRRLSPPDHRCRPVSGTSCPVHRSGGAWRGCAGPVDR